MRYSTKKKVKLTGLADAVMWKERQSIPVIRGLHVTNGVKGKRIQTVPVSMTDLVIFLCPSYVITVPYNTS